MRAYIVAYPSGRGAASTPTVIGLQSLRAREAEECLEPRRPWLIAATSVLVKWAARQEAGPGRRYPFDRVLFVVTFQHDYSDASLGAADSWAQEHAEFVDAVFDDFLTNRAWTSPNKLQRKLHRLKRRLKVFDLAQEMPPQLGLHWQGPDGHLMLRMRALQHCEKARPYLDAAVRLLGAAHERYTQDEEEHPSLRPDDLTSDVDRVAVLLLTHEPFHVIGSFGDPFGRGWSGPINMGLVHEVDGLRTLDDYLQLEATYFQRAGLVRPWHPAPLVANVAHDNHLEGTTDQPVGAAAPASVHDVFIVHGRDRSAFEAMTTFVSSLGLHAIDFDELIDDSKETTPYIGDMLDAALARARAIIVLLTGDDIASLQERFHQPDDPPSDTQPTPQARPNVIFEAGMAMALHKERTILVEIGTLRPFTDVAGRFTVRMDGSLKKRRDIVQRLKRAGCKLDESGAWQTVGEFTAPSVDVGDAAVSDQSAAPPTPSPFENGLDAGAAHDAKKVHAFVRGSTRRLAECVNSWIGSPPDLPTTIQGSAQLEHWRPLIDPMITHFGGTVTEVCRLGAGLIASGYDVTSLGRRLRDEFSRDHAAPTTWVAGATQLACRTIADQLLGVAYELEAWDAVRQLCAPTHSDSAVRTPWTLSYAYRWPTFFNGNARLAAEFAVAYADQSPIAMDLDIAAKEFVGACSAMQVALDVGAAAFNLVNGLAVNGYVYGLDNPATWAAVRRWEEQEGLLAALASLAGEDIDAFRAALPTRLSNEVARRQESGVVHPIPPSAWQAVERIAAQASLRGPIR